MSWQERISQILSCRLHSLQPPRQTQRTRP